MERVGGSELVPERSEREEPDRALGQFGLG